MNPTMRFIHTLELLRLIGRRAYLNCWAMMRHKE